MERCPTCNAKFRGKPVCHRCKTDLGLLIQIEKDAVMHLEKAYRAFDELDFEDMFFHAKRSFSLRHLQAAQKMLTIAAILTHRYSIAISLYDFL
ncbi:MAG: hypothetical protein ACKVE4_02055 [Dissulfuribacterales bacterium]